MGSNPKALLRSLVAVVVLALAGFGLPAYARGRDAEPGRRLAVLPVAARASAVEVRLPFPATHVGLRWRGSEDAGVEIRWLAPGAPAQWQRLPIWDDAGDPDTGIVATGLIRPEPGATGVIVRRALGRSRVGVVARDAGPDGAPRPAPRRVANGSAPPEPPVISRHDWGA